MERNEFTPIFVVMCEYFEATPSEGLTQVYFEDLKELSIEDFKRAFQLLRRSRVYKGLPKVAEIKEVIYGKIDDIVALAWESFLNSLRNIGPYESVIFEDGAIGRTIETMGGWQEVNKWTIDECRMRRKEFESIYLANLRKGNIEPKKFMGFFEDHNSGNIEWKEFTPDAKVISSHLKNIKLLTGGTHDTRND